MTAKLGLIALPRLILGSIFFLILFLSFTQPISAKTATPSAQSKESTSSATASAQVITPAIQYQSVNQITPQSPHYVGLMMHNLLHELNCITLGAAVDGPCANYLNGIPIISSNNEGGVLGITNKMLTAVVANPPIKTSEYLATLGESIGIVKEANAQVGGAGDGVLVPIKNLWQVSRNIAYAGMIIIFVVIGLMIMFRSRINPQTVISIQAALPGLVIGIIMITLSYFLASALSDIAFIGTDLVGYYFSFTGATGTAANPNPEPLSSLTARTPMTTIFSQLIGNVFNKTGSPGDILAVDESLRNSVNSVYTSITGFPKGILDLLVHFATIQFFMGILGPLLNIGSAGLGALPFGFTQGAAAITNILSGPIAGLAGFLTSTVFLGIPTILTLFFSFVGALMLIYSMFRLLVRLITNYLTIIYLTITAPFTFLFASLPGRSGMITDWIMQMLCNILAFPAVIAVFYFVAYILGPTRQNVFLINERATIVGSGAFPLLGGFDLEFIRILLAFGALLATPSIPELICRAISKIGPAGQLIEGEYNAAQRTAGDYRGRLEGGTRAVFGSYPDWRTRENAASRFGLPPGAGASWWQRMFGLVHH